MAKKKRMSAAQRRYFGKRTARRSYARRTSTKRRSSRRSSGGGMTGLLVGSAVYGAGRQWASDKLSPITSKVPAGDLADELVMGGLSYLVAKGKVPLVNKIPFSRDIGRAGLTIEAARVGEYFAQRALPTVTNMGARSSGVIYN